MRGVIRGIFRFDLPSFQRAGAIIAGLMITTSGYLVGSLAHHLNARKYGRNFKQLLETHN
jgi:hypothetical protein